MSIESHPDHQRVILCGRTQFERYFRLPFPSPSFTLTAQPGKTIDPIRHCFICFGNRHPTDPSCGSGQVRRRRADRRTVRLGSFGMRRDASMFARQKRSRLFPVLGEIAGKLPAIGLEPAR